MESKFIIKFDIDQRDLNNITIATDLIDGKPDRDLLINLCIVNNYDELEEYDGEWYNLGGMEAYLKSLWGGFFYEPCNRFQIDSVEIKGFDADSMSWYEIKDFSLDKLKELGIEDIDEAYEERIQCYDEENDYDDDEDDDDYDDDDYDDDEDEIGKSRRRS